MDTGLSILRRLKLAGRAGSLGVLLPATYLLLMVVSLGGVIVWTGLRLQSATLARAGDGLELQARLIAGGVQFPLEQWQEEDDEDAEESADDDRLLSPDSELVKLVQQLAQSSGCRVTLTDVRQRVIYSSDAVVPLNQPADSPEFSPAGDGRVIRWDVWSQEERLFVTAPIQAAGEAVVGYVQLSTPVEPLYGEVLGTWGSLVLAGTVMLALTMGISLGLVRFILRPILALTGVAGAMAAGDLNQQVAPAGPEEVRRLGEAFNQMAERVREMLARQQAFVAHAAHELRTPLTGLRLRLEMLQTHGDDVGRQQLYLEQMTGEVEHLGRLVEHLLALAALDERALPSRAWLDLAPLLYAQADELATLVQRAGQTLVVEVPPHLPPVLVNADQMQAVVRNLLDNAIKYTPSGGRLVLAAEGDRAEVRISVTDTGSGIPAELLPRIFERFYRVDPARSRRQGGAGLGLALVQGIVGAYGGRVEVLSSVGNGSCFTVHLPREI